MVKQKEHTPDELARARQLYERRLAPVDGIVAMLGLSRSNFYKRVREGGWERRRAGEKTSEFARAVVVSTAPAPALPETRLPERATAAAAAAADARAEARAALALRIHELAEREMDAIERILTMLDPSTPAEADRCARTLAGIARTLREVTALNEPEKAAPGDDRDPDDVPVDLDELRGELARALDELTQARASEEALEAQAASPLPSMS